MRRHPATHGTSDDRALVVGCHRVDIGAGSFGFEQVDDAVFYIDENARSRARHLVDRYRGRSEYQATERSTSARSTRW